LQHITSKQKKDKIEAVVQHKGNEKGSLQFLTKTAKAQGAWASCRRKPSVSVA